MACVHLAVFTSRTVNVLPFIGARVVNSCLLTMEHYIVLSFGIETDIYCGIVWQCCYVYKGIQRWCHFRTVRVGQLCMPIRICAHVATNGKVSVTWF